MWITVQAQWAKAHDVLPGVEGFALILQVHAIDEEVTLLLHDGSRKTLLPEERIEVYRKGDVDASVAIG